MRKANMQRRHVELIAGTIRFADVAPEARAASVRPTRPASGYCRTGAREDAMFKPNAEHKRALRLLAGCPDGAAAYCLTTSHAVALRTLVALVQHELANTRTTDVAARSGNRPAKTITRLRITNAGRRAISG